jgi:hypothetical protein
VPAARSPLRLVAALVAIAAFAIAARLLARPLLRARSVRRAAARHLAEARAAALRGDARARASALALALRAALAVRVPGARAAAVEELARLDARGVRGVVDALADLERARFAAPGEAPAAVDEARVRALLRAL